MTVHTRSGAGAALSFLDPLTTGRLDQHWLEPFPCWDEETGRYAISANSTIVSAAGQVATLIRERTDVDEIDRTGRLPRRLLSDLAAAGYFRLGRDRGIGGHGMSAHDVFRVITKVARQCMPVGQVLGFENGFCAAALLPGLPKGPVRDFVQRRVRTGAISALGITEPAGRNNTWPATTARLAADGASYLLRGEKIYAGNGPIAQLVITVATLWEQGVPRLALCFLDPDTPGFTVSASVEFMGSRGLPNGAWRFDDVRVPKEQVLLGAPGRPNPNLVIESIRLLGQLYTAGAPAAAVVENCLQWSREFVARRRIDGRNLGEYDQVQRIIAATVADAYAVDTVTRWCLLDSAMTDRAFERLAAKNILSLAAWRTADRTMTLFGAEGLETVESKRRRGAIPTPLERCFRDARGLRIIGNVDFRIDDELAWNLMEAGFTVQPGPQSSHLKASSRLSPANYAHLNSVVGQVHRFAETGALLSPQLAEVPTSTRQQHPIALGRIAGELFAMWAVLARTAQQPLWNGPMRTQDLADAYCTAARHRLAQYWRTLHADQEPDYESISRQWLSAPIQSPIH
jgi:alkylation response protein AidB-like acyl-CoA dehydrogenase